MKWSRKDPFGWCGGEAATGVAPGALPITKRAPFSPPCYQTSILGCSKSTLFFVPCVFGPVLLESPGPLFLVGLFVTARPGLMFFFLYFCLFSILGGFSLSLFFFFFVSDVLFFSMFASSAPTSVPMLFVHVSIYFTCSAQQSMGNKECFAKSKAQRM